MPKFKAVPPKAPKKVGNISNEEKQYITDNIRQMGIEAVARKLQRSAKTVKNIALAMGIKIDDTYTENTIVYQQITDELKRTPEHRNLRFEFSKRELSLFNDKYSRFLAQFREDVTATEQTQIFQAIRYEILINRVSVDLKKLLKEKRNLESWIDRFWKKWKDADPPESDLARLQQIQQEISGLRAGETSRTTELVKFQERHASLLKDLTATRAQRRDVLNASRDDIVGLLKMLADEKFRKSESDQNNLFKLAVAKESKRLASQHKYIDNSIDLPILNSENLEALDKLQDSEDKQKLEEELKEKETKNESTK